MTGDDPWDVFGEEEEDKDKADKEPEGLSTESLALNLTHYFVKERHLSSLTDIHIWGFRQQGSSCDKVWQEPLTRRGFTVIPSTDDETLVDVVLVLEEHADATDIQTASLRLVPGGFLALPRFLAHSFTFNGKPQPQLEEVWDVRNPIAIPDESSAALPEWVIFTKWSAPIQASTCPWLPAHHNLYAERQRASQATCTLTTRERESPTAVSEATVSRAVEKLQTHGYCIIPGLLDPETSQTFGKLSLADLAEAATVLKEKEGVDLREPRNSTQEPAAYRELSMREDLRMDLRHGPRLNDWRGKQGCEPVLFTALDDQKTLATKADAPNRFLRGHPVILEIVRRTMNLSDKTLAPGNWGRYNFGGRGSDGSFMDLRVGPVGVIISLPGSADQALHADTPHLMEMYDCLPAHYINVFTPGSMAHSKVGQTALVQGSHRLSYTAKLETDTEKMSWTSQLVRPELQLGDVLLFDCRILHFGLANTSSDIERPLIYTNMTQHWFSDPKNWNDRRPIFSSVDEPTKIEE